MASGIQEFNNKYIKRINNALKGQPDYIKGFVSSMSDVSLTTKYAYLLDVINFIEYINKPIESSTLDDFSTYITELEYKDNGEQITSSYRIAVYSALKKFNQYLYDTKRMADNYMLYVKRPKAVESQKTITKREKGFLTEREVEKYLQTIEDNNVNRYRQVSTIWNKRDLVIIEIFLYTGIRCSALSKLDRTSINFQEKALIVTDKGDKVKLFDLSDELLEDITEWLEIREEKLNDDDAALFISNRKKRMDQTSISNVVKKYSRDIKDKHITPHKLRATYGTQLYNETGDIYFVQDCMGHSNPKTTELYVRGKKHNTKKAMDIMSKMLSHQKKR